MNAAFEVTQLIRAEHPEKRPPSEFKATFREQFLMILLDERKAAEAIPTLLEGQQKRGLNYLR